MILVPNRRQPLNGNRIVSFIICIFSVLALQSCAFFEGLFQSKKPVERKERVVEEEKVTIEEIQWKDLTRPESVITTYPDPKVEEEDRPLNVLCILPFKGSLENRVAGFYSGFKWASESYRGTKQLKVTTIDVSEVINQPSVLGRLIDPNIVDLIVAPYSSDHVNALVKYAKSFEIPIISPWNTSQDIDAYEGFVQLNPDLNTHLNAMVHYASDRFGAATTMILSERKDEHLVNIMTHTNPQVKSYFTSSNPKDDIIRLQQYIDAHGITSVIIPSWRSSDEAYFISLLSALNAARQGKILNVFALSSWMNNSNINFDQFSEMNLHFTSSRFLDEDLPRVQQLDNQFYLKYKYFASDPVYYGHDLFVMIAQLFESYGFLWVDQVYDYQCDDCFFRYNLVHSISNSGAKYVENDHVDIIKLNNFVYERVN